MQKKFILEIQTKQRADVYLSCSWQPVTGQDAAWHIVNKLDDENIRIVGDVPDLPTQEDGRIKRIMKSCEGYVAILPFRSHEKFLTSPYIYRELELAYELELPTVIFQESGVGWSAKRDDDSGRVKLVNSKSEEILEYCSNSYIDLYDFTPSDTSLATDIPATLHEFIERIFRTKRKEKPYAFLASRLQPDFSQARDAIKIATEIELGMPCIWSDDGLHKTNIKGVREETKYLIKNAAIVIADISFSPENPHEDNPSRAHEVGMAEAYNKSLILSAQEPARVPYFSAGDNHVEWWHNEDELFLKISQLLRKEKEILGRQIYNWKIWEKANQSHPISILPSQFTYNEKEKYFGPASEPLTTKDSWFVAVGIGLFVFASSSLVDRFLDYGDSLDLLPLLAAVLSGVFASDLGRSFRNILWRKAWLRWLIPSLGLFMIVLWGALKGPSKVEPKATNQAPISQPNIDAKTEKKD